MAKTAYIKGTSHSVMTPEGEKLTGVSTFWHIRKPRSTRATLCGAVMSNEYGVQVTRKKPEPAPGKHDGFCHFCTRIQEGKDPVFDPPSASKREDKGTRANPSRNHLFGEWNAGEKVA